MDNPENSSTISLPMFTPPLGLYVHIPWCVRKCPYCDFNSHEIRQDMPEEAYLEALLKDLTLDMQFVGERQIETVFFGGGTPSLFNPSTIGRFLEILDNEFNLASDAEVTLEANPGTLDRQKLEGLLRAGVNRISIGVQSFNDLHLERLGRIHQAEDAFNAAVEAKKAGFSQLNLDLMFGLPEQSRQHVIEDLLQAISLEPSHISFYQLTLEPNTLFFRAPPPLPDDDVIWSFQEAGFNVLDHAGFEHYEVSAWSLPGQACRHNLNYWRFGDYLGVGAGAHGKLTDSENGCIRRYSKQKHPQRYLTLAHGQERLAVDHLVDANQLPLEFFMNHLRLREGFSEKVFQGSTGLAFSSVKDILDDCRSLGLVTNEGDRWRCSGKGWLFLDDILCRFA